MLKIKQNIQPNATFPHYWSSKLLLVDAVFVKTWSVSCKIWLKQKGYKKIIARLCFKIFKKIQKHSKIQKALRKSQTLSQSLQLRQSNSRETILLPSFKTHSRNFPLVTASFELRRNCSIFFIQWPSTRTKKIQEVQWLWRQLEKKKKINNR